VERSKAKNAASASHARRRVLRTILASAAATLGSSNGRAQQRLATPRGTGRAPIARSATLPLAVDLASDGRAGATRRQPILLFFDRDECPYCERALREYLVPMSRDEWRDRALFRQIEIDRPLSLVDFDGSTTTHSDVAARYGVTLSPTVLVVGPDGRPLHEPIVGLLTVDFYAAYLGNALSAAAATLER